MRGKMIARKDLNLLIKNVTDIAVAKHSIEMDLNDKYDMKTKWEFKDKERTDDRETEIYTATARKGDKRYQLTKVEAYEGMNFFVEIYEKEI
jgi:hypothetical protein